MTEPKKRWSGTRLNEFSEEVRGDIKKLRDDMRSGFEKVDTRLDRLDAKLDRLVFWLLGGMASIVVTILATLVAVIVRGS